MKIRYEVTFDDIVAFNRYHLDHSPAMKRQRATATWGVPLVVLFVCGALALLDEFDPTVILSCGAVFCVIYVLLVRRSIPATMEKNVRKLYCEGSNKGVLGQHELELSQNSLSKRTDSGMSSVFLSAIDRIVTTDDYTFIYINAVTAHVIPRHSLSEIEYRTFVDAVNTEWSKAQPPKSVLATRSLALLIKHHLNRVAVAPPCRLFELTRSASQQGIPIQSLVLAHQTDRTP